jgi:hypothetical protein
LFQIHLEKTPWKKLEKQLRKKETKGPARSPPQEKQIKKRGQEPLKRVIQGHSFFNLYGP